jgi:PPM family protein phosphatase
MASPAEGLRQLTTDHTPVAEAVAAGLISAEQAATHPERNLLSRVVGLEPDVEVDVYEPVTLEPGDRLLLCTDGLTAVLADEAIARLLADLDDPSVACEELVRATLAGGAPDNVSVVVGVARP